MAIDAKTVNYINKMFFIVGRGRSGTSLLVSMLDQHSEIVIPPEAIFIMVMYNKYAKYKRMSKKKVMDFYKYIWIEKWIKKWNLNKEELKKDLIECGENASFPDLCKIIYYHYAKGRNKLNDNVLIGDKNPQYSLFAKNLIELFPEAKFVHLVRDYRDNILSFKKVRFDLNLTSLLAYRWKNYNQTILKLKEQYPDKFCTIRYEQLLLNPEKELRIICDFLGIKYEAGMLEYYKNQDIKVPDFHKNLKKPILKTNFNLWKKKMTEDDIIKADIICSEIGEKLGYKRANKKNKFLFFFTGFFASLWGWLSIFFEKFFFYLPLFICKRIMDSYRKMVHRGKDYI